MTFSTLIFPTVFRKNKVSIVLDDMLFKLGRINNNFPNRALAIELSLSRSDRVAEDVDNGKRPCGTDGFPS